MSAAPRFAWLVLAHADAAQLSALIDRIAPPGGPDFAVVHLDAKSPLWRESRGAFLAARPNVHLVANPVAVHWGHASQVAAIRLLLAEALRHPFTHAHLVSGADWPLVPRAAICADLAAAPARDCQIEARPGAQSERMERIRLDARWLRPDPARPWHWYPARALRRLSALLPPRRARPWGAWHKGSTWWSLPHDACAAVLAELARAPLFGTVCADEHLVQTIVARHFAQRLAPSNRRFILWDGGASPRTLTAADWPAALASGAWLARKVSRRADPFFLDLPPDIPPS